MTLEDPGLTYALLSDQEGQDEEEEEEKEEVVKDACSSEEKKKEKRRILKNIFALSIHHSLLSMSYHGLSWLQAVLFMEHGLGTTCQGLVQFARIFSALLLPRLFIVKLGQKWTIVLMALAWVAWMIANAFADWLTLGITSVTLGLAAGPYWTATNSYVAKSARRYAELTEGLSAQDGVARAFGAFHAMTGVMKVVTSVVSACILTPSHANATSPLYEPSAEELALCGVNDCPSANASHHNHNYEKISNPVLYTLVIVYIATSIISIIIAATLVDPLPQSLQDPVTDTSSVWQETAQLVTATIRLLVVPELVLLLPFFVTPGMDFAFFHADWARAYVTCALGKAYIGWTAIPQSVTNIPASLLGGFLTKCMGRGTMILIGLLLFLTISIIQLTWSPHPGQIAVFYIVPMLYGLQALAGPAYSALISTEYPDNLDAAFSFTEVSMSLGGTIAFIYSGYICTRLKLYILIIMISLSIVGYLCAEYLFWRKRKEQQTHEYESVALEPREDESFEEDMNSDTDNNAKTLEDMNSDKDNKAQDIKNSDDKLEDNDERKELLKRDMKIKDAASERE